MYKRGKTKKHSSKACSSAYIFILLILLFAISFARILGAFDKVSCSPKNSHPTAYTNSGGIIVSFSPGTPGAISSDILRTLEPLLLNAQKSIYGAIYDFDYEPVAEILVKKFQQGIDVKLVVEADNSNKKGVRICESAGIPIVKDLNRAYMHNKFFIVDNLYTWTGSTNLTVNCLFFNNNNSVIIASSEVAKDYLEEFDEMFFLKSFGRGSPPKTNYNSIQIGNNVVSIYFSPDDKVEEKLLNEIDKSTQRIYFMAFSFTSQSVAEKLVRAKAKGLTIKGIFEKRNAGNPASKDEFLHSQGIEIRYDSNTKTMHNKVFIFDDETVWTGSYNFSANAEKENDENVIIIRAREVAQAYLKEFYRLFDSGIPIRN